MYRNYLNCYNDIYGNFISSGVVLSLTQAYFRSIILFFVFLAVESNSDDYKIFYRMMVKLYFLTFYFHGNIFTGNKQ